MDSSRARSAGLVCRPLTETVADTWAWLRAGGRAVPHERFAEQGLSPEWETELVNRWDLRRGGSGAGQE